MLDSDGTEVNYLRSAYFYVFNFLAEGRKTNSQKVQQELHRHLVVVLSTSLLMWAYAFVAKFEMESSVPVWAGVLCSIIHLLSPLLWKIFDKVFWPLFFALVPGVIHQATFSFYSGGFESETIIWLTVHPMLGGIVGGRKGLYVFGGLSLLTTLGFLVLKIMGYPFPDLLSPFGHVISQVFLLLGYFFIAFSAVAIYMYVEEQTKQRLEVKNNKIQNLLRVLVHDISNPLSVADYQLSASLRREDCNEAVEKRIKKASKAIDIVANISKKVRELHSDEIVIENRRLEKCSMDECYEHMLLVFEDKFENKKITFSKAYKSNFDFEVSKDVFLNQILSNLVSNAIKFTPVGGEIEIIANKLPGEVQIGVRDTGVGMNEEALQELKEKGKLRSTIGESGELGTGFGLMIVNSFVIELGAELEIFSTEKKDGIEEHGSLFLIKIPS
ncbi:MAG: hypothetical protein CL674_00380 [Bdellovibrionaceae bacterium]|nr:hypothetical protein [Pseudobdellovibrionaceae bacterium]|tara:strand:- start:40 stop:1365 length:1326 start_codon:yes stop_codon:yes gene_type:complete